MGRLSALIVLLPLVLACSRSTSTETPKTPSWAPFEERNVSVDEARRILPFRALIPGSFPEVKEVSPIELTVRSNLRGQPHSLRARFFFQLEGVDYWILISELGGALPTTWSTPTVDINGIPVSLVSSIDYVSASWWKDGVGFLVTLGWMRPQGQSAEVLLPYIARLVSHITEGGE
jgi:hypothetical protein